MGVLVSSFGLYTLSNVHLFLLDFCITSVESSVENALTGWNFFLSQSSFSCASFNKGLPKGGEVPYNAVSFYEVTPNPGVANAVYQQIIITCKFILVLPESHSPSECILNLSENSLFLHIHVYLAFAE